MPKITLRFLKLEDREEFEAAMNSDWEGFGFLHYFESLAQSSFEKYVDIIPGLSKGEHIPKDHVPCSFLFAFNEANELVGRTSIRHELDKRLLKFGGHIGYAVVPAHRKKGYATSILSESLLYVKTKLSGIDRVLLTCDEGNIASEKTIRSNGGVLENIIDRDGGGRTMRFWIDL